MTFFLFELNYKYFHGHKKRLTFLPQTYSLILNFFGNRVISPFYVEHKTEHFTVSSKFSNELKHVLLFILEFNLKLEMFIVNNILLAF